MKPVYITHTAAYLPNDPVDNDNMETLLGSVCEKTSRARRTVLRSNGIKQRHYAIDKLTGHPTHTNAQLTSAAIAALTDHEFSLTNIDCLACGTSIPDQIMPNHAVMVHGELGIPPCEVVATSGVCVAGVTAMKYAYLSVACGESQNAVSTGSEIASAMMRGNKFEPEIEGKLDKLSKQPELAFEKDFLRWMLSDGAGAIVLKPKPRQQGLSLKIDWIFERSYANEMTACMYSGAQKQDDGSLKSWQDFLPNEWLNESIFSIKQDVKLLNEHIMYYTVERPLTEILQCKDIHPDNVDHFLPHYSSHFFRQKVHDSMSKVGFGIPFERWFTNLESKGNTGSASIYIMLDELFRSGTLKEGQKILCYVPESGRFSTAFISLTVCTPE